MTSTPFISIIMPTFNSEAHLHDALESLRRQSFKNWELLVCDGGSGDGTLKIFEAAKDIPAKIVSTSDNGVPDALNKGFSGANGDILCWLNSDDVLLTETALQRVARTFGNRQAKVAIGDCAVLEPDGTIKKTLISYPPIDGFPRSGGNIFTGSLYFTRDAWQAFGGFSGKYKYAFEYELTAALSSEFRFKKIEGVIGGFRIHAEGLSSRFRTKMTAEVAEVYQNTRSIPLSMRIPARAFSLMREGMLFKTIRTRFSDPYRGMDWSDVSQP